MSYLWYIPNQVESGHRGDETTDGWGTLGFSVDLARTAEEHGWEGALLGTGWGRPDTFTLGAALVSLTTAFKPLIAVRPGYWQPAHFASAAATLDHLSGGRVLVNVVSGLDNLAAYGDRTTNPVNRYDRTREFIELVRRLWAEENVTYRGEHFSVEGSTVVPRPDGFPDRHPTLYFGGASAPAERVAAAEADVQLFWGEPLEGLAQRIERLKKLEAQVGRRHPPLEFGLRITTLIRDTSAEAWRDAEAKVAQMAAKAGGRAWAGNRKTAIGQQRLFDLAERGEVLDTCLYTAPGRAGGGGAGTTWLVGAADEVAQALQRYRELGITHFVLSDTPYKQETIRVGDELLPRLRALENAR
ncbi:MAG: LLM class flavin-dependent oxidoreductase [Trebonia sp.]|jgi:alkanesulfonate monooxygenase